MTRKYFCDYCQRTFRDTVDDRRTHQQSTIHKNFKFQYEIDFLRKQTKLYSSVLQFVFSSEDLSILNEIITKPTVCRFFADNQCRYGVLCKNSHRLTETQIHEHKDRFLKLFSSTKKFDLIVDRKPLLEHLSKRKLKKELSINLWLEKRFEIDVRSDFTQQLLDNFVYFKQFHYSALSHIS